jgi:transcriptional regulator with XRE-family HTH domain
VAVEEQRVGHVGSKELKVALGAEMKAARRSAGWTIEAWLAARDLAYSVSHVSNIENGRNKPPRELVLAYDAEFGEQHRVPLLPIYDELLSSEQAEKRAALSASARSRGLATEATSPGRPSAGKGSGGPRRWSSAPSPGRIGLVVGAALLIAAIVLLLGDHRPSLSQFASRADAICAVAVRPLDEIERGVNLVMAEVSRHPDAASVRLHRLIVLADGLQDRVIPRLRALEVPGGDDGDVARAFVHLTDRVATDGIILLSQTSEVLDAGRVPDPLSDQRRRARYDQEARAHDLDSKRIGATVCAKAKLARPWGTVVRRARVARQ